MRWMSGVTRITSLVEAETGLNFSRYSSSCVWLWRDGWNSGYAAGDGKNRERKKALRVYEDCSQKLFRRDCTSQLSWQKNHPPKRTLFLKVAFLDGQKLCIEGWKWLKGTAVLIKSGRLVVNSFLLMNKVKLLEKEIVKDWVFHRVRF